MIVALAVYSQAISLNSTQGQILETGGRRERGRKREAMTELCC